MKNKNTENAENTKNAENAENVAKEVRKYLDSRRNVSDAVAVAFEAEASLLEVANAKTALTTLQLSETTLKAALIGLQQQESALKEKALAVQTARAIALVELINDPELVGLFGKKDIHLRYTEAGYLLSTVTPNDIPNWASYGFSFTAQSVCDKLGIFVGNASANRILFHKAQKAGMDIPTFLKSKGIS
ncbi:MAG: hypothetical protein AB1478_02800 [Nitrospirota bacterium]